MMKSTFLILSLLTLMVSCGKNSSGKSGPTGVISPYTVQEEEAIRQDFIREGKEVLQRYDNEIQRMFGVRTVGLIRNRLRYENVQLSEAILYGEQNLVTRSTNRNALVTLYIGRERPNLSWDQYRRQRSSTYTRLVLHELLLLGEVNDMNFVYTDQILRRR